MAIALAECGALILAGGRSRRMGRCKASLSMRATTLLQHLMGELNLFPELILSSNEPALCIGHRGMVVKDKYINCGPLAGLHAGLCATGKQYLFCVPCELPCFTSRLIEPMLDAFQTDLDALVCVDSTGKEHPLCGIYAKSALPHIEQALIAGDFRVKHLLQTITNRHFLSKSYVEDRAFLNLNTPQEYQSFLDSMELI